MARQRPTRAPGLVIGPCIVEIDRIVIREVQYQFEVNHCRNEEIIVIDNFGWAWPMWAGRPRDGNGAMHKVQYQFEVNRCRNEEVIAWPKWAGRLRINLIVIRKVQYQFEVNRCNFWWAWPMWAGRPRIDRIVIREVQYQFEDNRCRNEEIIFQGSSANSVGGDSGQDGRTDGRTAEITSISPRFSKSVGIKTILGAPQVEIDRIVIKDVKYQFEVNRCRNKEIIAKGNFGWTWPMWTGRPRINCVVIREVKYQFEMNRCRNEEIIVNGNFRWAWPMWAWPMWAGRPRTDLKGNFGWAWPMWAGCPRAEIDRIVIREVQYQFEVNRCRNEEIIVKGYFGWAWPICLGAPGLVMGPCIVEIDRIFIREAQYQFEVNRCRNEEVNFKDSSANSVGGAGGQDGQTDGQTHITTISPLFLRKTWG
ncbi:hypothetical protein DPMN_187880 [Dreissena polymorpha]|uniref:Uncharacterized protein n=1 Tax=Dreissena polymorpha TaxID=45954 RepID=A0A9D4DPV6_DREPO|nr:hypothetical protein DPMN_187880 [Dreissena polymorpha]